MRGNGISFQEFNIRVNPLGANKMPAGGLVASHRNIQALSTFKGAGALHKAFAVSSVAY